jgi:hypothetical protein
VVAERPLDFLRLEAFPAIEAVQQGLDDLFGFVLAKILEKCSPAIAWLISVSLL